MIAWLKRLFRRVPPDNRWWEDGRPVFVMARPMTVFEVIMRRQFFAAEFDITVDIDRQFFGQPHKELDGIAGIVWGEAI